MDNEKYSAVTSMELVGTKEISVTRFYGPGLENKNIFAEGFNEYQIKITLALMNVAFYSGKASGISKMIGSRN